MNIEIDIHETDSKNELSNEVDILDSTNKLIHTHNSKSELISELIHKNTIVMLKKRGYINLKEENNTIIGNRDHDNQKIIVFFTQEDKIGIKLFQIYNEKMINLGINKGILIIKGYVTSNVKDEISILATAKVPIYIEVFSENKLIFDITEHYLVPKHEKISNKEKEELLNRYNIKETQLPKICYTDPVVRYYDFQKMDILKITTISETAGISVYYKIII